MLEFDLHGQKSKVALLAVDKAIYALHADNKLTTKQVTLSYTLFTLTFSYITLMLILDPYIIIQ